MNNIKFNVCDPADFIRETKYDIHKLPRNLIKSSNSDQTTTNHFQAERQYQAAVNAAKLKRLFTKPFLCSCDIGSDSANVIATHPNSLGSVVFGSNNGYIIYYNSTIHQIIKSVKAHEDPVRALAYRENGSLIYSSGGNSLKQWRVESDRQCDFSTPVSTVTLSKPATCMSHHPIQDHFLLGSSDSLRLYHADKQLDEPVSEWETRGAYGMRAAHYCPSQPVYIAASTSGANLLLLFDVRCPTPARQRRTDFAFNSLAWNPQQPMQLMAACQDHEVYSYDLRNWNSHLRLYRGHVNAVMDVHVAPTGQHFASAGYDDTVRVWSVEATRPLATYHSKRMRQVYTVRYTGCARFILSASVDCNVRVWKAEGSEPASLLTPRQRADLHTSQALTQQFEAHPAVRKIAGSHRLPRPLQSAALINQQMEKKLRRKEARAFLHAPPKTARLEKLREKKAGEEMDV